MPAKGLGNLLVYGVEFPIYLSIGMENGEAGIGGGFGTQILEPAA